MPFRLDKPSWSFLLWPIVWLVLTLWFSTGSDFPYLYHPDEPKKVMATTSEKQLFNHPHLLVTGTRLLSWLTGVETDQDRARVGRAYAAGMLALGLVCLAVVTKHLAGPWAAIFALLVGGLYPLVFEAGHYLKEDAFLLGTLGIFILGLHFWDQRKRSGEPLKWHSALLFGISFGLVVSAKYIGFVYAPLLIWRLVGCSLQRVLVCLAGVLGTFALVNYRAWTQFSGIRGDVQRELETLGSQPRDGAIETPHFEFGFQLLTETPWVLWLGLLAILIWPLARLHGIKSLRLCFELVGFALLMLGILCWCVYHYPRYLLPVIWLLLPVMSAGLIVVVKQVVSRFPSGMRRVAGVTLSLFFLLAATVPLVSPTTHLLRCFHNDTRTELYEYVRDQLPESSVIAQESFIRLPWHERDRHPDVRPQIPQQVLNGRPLKALGNLQELRALGVTHIAWGVKNELTESDPWVREISENSHVIWSSQGPYGPVVASNVELRELAP